MLIAVTDLSATYTRLELVELCGGRRLVAGEPTAAQGDLLSELMNLVERHRLRLRDLEGFAVCSEPGDGREADLNVLKGLALSQGRPMVGFYRAKALALAAMGRVPVGTALVCGLEPDSADGPLRISAFRQDVTGGLKELYPETGLTLQGLLSLISDLDPAVGFGAGYRRHQRALEKALPPLAEAADTLQLNALGAAAVSMIRAARGQRSARQIFAINSLSTAAAQPSAAFTEWR